MDPPITRPCTNIATMTRLIRLPHNAWASCLVQHSARALFPKSYRWRSPLKPSLETASRNVSLEQSCPACFSTTFRAIHSIRPYRSALLYGQSCTKATSAPIFAPDTSPKAQHSSEPVQVCLSCPATRCLTYPASKCLTYPASRRLIDLASRRLVYPASRRFVYPALERPPFLIVPFLERPDSSQQENARTRNRREALRSTGETDTRPLGMESYCRYTRTKALWSSGPQSRCDRSLNLSVVQKVTAGV